MHDSKNNQLVQKDCYSSISVRRIILALVICIITANIIVGLRYLNSFNPKGFDTPYYVYILRKVYSGKFLSFPSYFLITFLLIPLTYIFNGDPFLLGIAIPFYISTIFIIIVFISFFIMTKSLIHSLFIAICAVSNFFFVRLTYDLFSQTLTISLFYLLIAIFTNLFQSNASRKDYHISLLKAGIILTLIFLTNIVLSFVIYIFFVLLSLILTIKLFKTCPEKIETNKSKVSAIILLPVINASFAIAYYIVFVHNVENIINVYVQIVTRETSFLRPRAGWEWIIYEENLPILVLCSLAVTYYIIRERIFLKLSYIFLLALWSSYIFSLIFITNYIQSYRLILFLPIAIVAGSGIFHLLEERKLQRTLSKFKNIRLAQVIKIGLAILLITTIFPLAEIPSYNYFPRDAEILSRLASHFGFDSTEVIYLISKKEITNVSPYWYNAYLGNNVFIGNISQLLARNVTASKIVIHENLYPLDHILWSSSESIGDGIYLINITYLKSILKNNYVKIKNDVILYVLKNAGKI